MTIENKSYDYSKLLLDKSIITHIDNSIKAAKADGNSEVYLDTDRILSLFTDKLSTQEYAIFNIDDATEFLLSYADSLMYLRK